MIGTIPSKILSLLILASVKKIKFMFKKKPSVKKSKKKKKNLGEGDDDDEEKQKDEIKVSKYHFEEMDSTQIKRYPRLINSMRDAVTRETRSSKRQEIKERKKREKESELKRLRKLKKEELKERLNKLKEISGNDKLDLDDLDLNILIDDENDFDEKKYDEKMKLLFGDNYYSENDAKIGEFEKPEFEFDEAIDGDDEQYNVRQYILFYFMFLCFIMLFLVLLIVAPAGSTLNTL